MAQTLNTYYGYCEILAWVKEYFSIYTHLLTHIQTIFGTLKSEARLDPEYLSNY